MRAELIKLHQRLQTTMIYVTHDQTEAMTMGTRIAVLRDGLLQQLDTPQQVYDHPSNMFVAGFIGSPSMNFVEARLTGDPDDIWVDAGSFKVQVPAAASPGARATPGQGGLLRCPARRPVRPEVLPTRHHRKQFTIKAQVDVTELLGSLIYLYLLVGDQQLVAVVDPRTEFKTGDDVMMTMDMHKMHIFDRHSQEAYL